MDETYKLCFVTENWAYFTTRKLDEQWGDDWGDAPYEYNAGLPYWWNERVRRYNSLTGSFQYEPNPEPRWEIHKVAFDGDFDLPHEQGREAMSPYSVRDINKKDVPWLKTGEYSSRAHVEIWAGTTYPEFVQWILQGGGMVYAPVKAREQ